MYWFLNDLWIHQNTGYTVFRYKRFAWPEVGLVGNSQYDNILVRAIGFDIFISILLLVARRDFKTMGGF